MQWSVSSRGNHVIQYSLHTFKMVRWVINYLASAALLSAPVSIPVIYDNLPGTIRNHTTVQQFKDAVVWVKNLTTEQQEGRGNHLMGTMQVPEGPSKNEMVTIEMELDKTMVNITDLTMCQSMKNINVTVYDTVIDNVGVELKLTQAETEAIKLAKNMDETVKALEKFEQSLGGFFYFGRITTKKRPNGNIDLAIVLHGFRWNLEAQVKEDEDTGEIKRFLQSITPKKKDLFKKLFRSVAVETFSKNLRTRTSESGS